MIRQPNFVRGKKELSNGNVVININGILGKTSGRAYMVSLPGYRDDSETWSTPQIDQRPIPCSAIVEITNTQVIVKSWFWPKQKQYNLRLYCNGFDIVNANR